jgi:putative FmdB family regulatory protein
MPIYEYECETCGHRFERRQSMSDQPLKNCPQCGGSVRRLVGRGVGFISKDSVGSRGLAEGCSLERSGMTPTVSTESKPLTCCGRDGRCDAPPCGESES